MTYRNFLKKKLPAGAILLAMVMSLASCGRKDEQEDASTKRDYVYTAEYITLDNAENLNTYDAQIRGDMLYYADAEYDENGSKQYICGYSLTESKEVSRFLVGEGQGYINGFQVLEDGNFCTLTNLSQYDNDGNWISESVVLAVSDAEGNQLWEKDVTGDMGSGDTYVRTFTADKEGRLYLVMDSAILLYRADGTFAGQIQMDGSSWVNGAGSGADGKVYISYESYDEAAGSRSGVLAEVDFDGKTMGKTYQNFPGGNGNSGLICGGEHDFVVNDGNHVYGYDLDTQEKEELFSWVDCDINPSYVDNMGVMEDGRIFVLIREWGTGEISAAYLAKTDASALPDKVELVVGTISESQELQTAVVNFNRQSDTCRLTIKSYLDTDNWNENSYADAVAAMNSAIASGSCPDIIVLSEVNVEALAGQGVFEDLRPFLQQSSVLDEADFLKSALNGYTVDDKIVGIPYSFTMQTMVGKSSDLGSDMGWTLNEMIDYAEGHPDSALVDYANRASILSICLNLTQESFIDYSTGTCNFNSDEFKRVLEFVADYPEEFDWENNETSTPVLVQNGEVLMQTVYVSDLEDVQMYPAMFGENVTFIGYPTIDGVGGCIMNSYNAMGIASKSANKEAAWSFLEYFLNREDDGMFSWGLPSRVSALEAKIEKETTVEYVLDENGDPLLDDDGNPIEVSSGGSIGYDGWEYEYHKPTEEEVALVRELIDQAQPAAAVDNTIINIITEEAAAYFAGQKSVDDVAGVIQSRVQVYVNENQ